MGMLPQKTHVVVDLLQKYGELGSDQLTPSIVGEFVSASGVEGVEVTDAKFVEVLETLKEANVNKLADLVGQPHTLGSVMAIFKPKDPPQDRLHTCTSCGALNFIPERE
jgi:hypothetical protein